MTTNRPDSFVLCRRRLWLLSLAAVAAAPLPSINAYKYCQYDDPNEDDSNSTTPSVIIIKCDSDCCPASDEAQNLIQVCCYDTQLSYWAFVIGLALVVLISIVLFKVKICHNKLARLNNLHRLGRGNRIRTHDLRNAPASGTPDSLDVMSHRRRRSKNLPPRYDTIVSSEHKDGSGSGTPASTGDFLPGYQECVGQRVLNRQTTISSIQLEGARDLPPPPEVSLASTTTTTTTTSSDAVVSAQSLFQTPPETGLSASLEQTN